MLFKSFPIFHKKPSPQTYCHGELRNDLLNDQRFVSNAKLIAPIRKGCFGRVYKAISDDGSTIVVKVIPFCFSSSPSMLQGPIYEEMKSEALNEPKIHEKLQHENIIRILRYYTRENCVVLHMDYFDGEPLWRVLRRKHVNIGENNAIEIVRQLCSAIKYLQEMNVVHGDLHLGNVLVNDENVVKLIDFGMAAIGETSTETKKGDRADLNSIQHMMYVTSTKPKNIKDWLLKRLYKWSISLFSDLRLQIVLREIHEMYAQ